MAYDLHNSLLALVAAEARVENSDNLPKGYPGVAAATGMGQH
jgi:hypothetical protein